jgi:transcriptional regulator GlxA family with amidase domain
MQDIPIRISILILDESNMLTVASVVDPVRAANRLSAEQVFEWEICSPKGEPVKLTGNIEMKCQGAFSSAKGGDYLIIIASFNQDAHGDRSLVQELRRKASSYKTVCAVEAGTWILARSAIIKDQRVTTHWEDIEAMRHQYPSFNIVSDRYVTEENIWTCGGASPALDMMLHLIEKEQGRPRALEVASVFIYDQMHASTDSQPSVSLGKLEYAEPRIGAAVRLMEDNIEAPILIAIIAQRLQTSAKTLEVIFKKHLGQTPAKYYLGLRLSAARKLLLDSSLDILEISIQCGFASQSSFSRSFSQRFASSPSAMRSSAKALAARQTV